MLCILEFAHQHAEAGSKTVVFAHVNVVPMDGDRILTDQDVTVVDDRISSIEPAASPIVPKDAQVIEATGRFLMPGLGEIDRKSTRLNSSHSQISYAVFCLKKKNK